MSLLVEVRRGLDAAVIGTARTSQAAVIEALDRAVGGPKARREGGRRSPLGRLLNAQLELIELCLGDAATVADDSFRSAARLLSLHREFVQRVFEAVDTRDATRFLRVDGPTAPVVRLDTSRAQHR